MNLESGSSACSRCSRRRLDRRRRGGVGRGGGGRLLDDHRMLVVLHLDVGVDELRELLGLDHVVLQHHVALVQHVVEGDGLVVAPRDRLVRVVEGADRVGLDREQDLRWRKRTVSRVATACWELATALRYEERCACGEEEACPVGGAPPSNPYAESAAT